MNEEIYMIMKKMIQDEEIGILLNRNPTISYGSILYLKVAGIKHDYEDLTMSVHNSILSLLAGDYDKLFHLLVITINYNKKKWLKCPQEKH